MKTFSYSARTTNGKKVRGVAAAANATEVRDRLLQQSMFPIKIADARTSLFQGREALGDREAGEIARDLARFLKAGLPLVASLRALATSGFSRKTQRLLEGAAQEMETGTPLSAILERQPGRVIKALAGVIRVGERTGRLGEALSDAANSFALAAGFREQVGSALAYPILVLSMVIGALGVFVGYVLPNLRPLFEGPGLTPPPGISTLFQVADILGLVGPFILLVIGLLWAVILFVPLVRDRVRRSLELFTFSKAGLGLASLIVYAGVARRLGLGVSAGVSVPEALSSAVLASSYATVRYAGETAVRSMAAGVSLSRVLDDMPGVPASLVNLARAGETAGRISPALKEAADLLEQSARSKTDRLVALLAPAVTIVTGAIVGVVVVTIFSGLASVADGLLE